MVETTNFRFTEVDASYATPAALVAVLQDFQNDAADVMGRHFSVDMADGDVDLDAAVASGDVQIGLRYATFRFTGTNAAIRDVIIPDKQRYYLIWNDTTGGFDIRIVTVTSGNVTYNIPAGRAAWVQVDDSLNVRIVKAQTIELEEEGSSVNSAILALDFLGVDIGATDAGGGVADITLQPLGSGADGIAYVDTLSGLYETSVQGAVDRFDERVQGLGGDTLEHIESKIFTKAEDLTEIIFSSGTKNLDEFDELHFFFYGDNFDSGSSGITMEFYNGTEWDRDRSTLVWFVQSETHRFNTAGGTFKGYDDGTVCMVCHQEMPADAVNAGSSSHVRIIRPMVPGEETSVLIQGHNFISATRDSDAHHHTARWNTTDNIEKIRFAAHSPAGAPTLEFGDGEVHLYGVRKLKGKHIGAWELIDEWEQEDFVDGFDKTNEKFRDPNWLALRIESSLIGSASGQTQMRIFLSDDGGGTFPTGLWKTTGDYFNGSAENRNAWDWHVLGEREVSGDDGVAANGTHRASTLVFNNNNSSLYKYFNSYLNLHTEGGSGRGGNNGGVWEQAKAFDTIRFRGREAFGDTQRDIKGRVQVWGLRKVPPIGSTIELIKYIDLDASSSEVFDEASMADNDWVNWFAVGFVVPSTGPMKLLWELSDDGGSTYAEANNDAMYDGRDSGGSNLEQRANATVEQEMNPSDAGGSAQEGLGFYYSLLFPRRVNFKNGFSHTVYSRDTDADVAIIRYGYGRYLNNAIDTLRFSPDTGTVTGWIALYGIRSVPNWNVPTRIADDVVVDVPIDGEGLGQALRQLGRRLDVVIQEENPSGVSEITLTHTGIVAFEDLKIRLRGIILSGDDHLELEVSNDFGATYKGASYRFRIRAEDVSGNIDTDDDGAPSAGAAVIRLTSDTANWEVDSAATSSLDLDIVIKNLKDDALHKQVEWSGTYRRGDNGDVVNVEGWGLWEGGTVSLNSFRIRGNASGTTITGKAILIGEPTGG